MEIADRISHRLTDLTIPNIGKFGQRIDETVCRGVVDQWNAGQTALLGVMLESHLRAGRQDWTRSAPLAYGVSITDPCIGWEETAALLRETAASVRTRAAA